jgi:hypothetical protein
MSHPNAAKGFAASYDDDLKVVLNELPYELFPKYAESAREHAKMVIVSTIGLMSKAKKPYLGTDQVMDVIMRWVACNPVNIQKRDLTKIVAAVTVIAVNSITSNKYLDHRTIYQLSSHLFTEFGGRKNEHEEKLLANLPIYIAAIISKMVMNKTLSWQVGSLVNMPELPEDCEEFKKFFHEHEECMRKVGFDRDTVIRTLHMADNDLGIKIKDGKLCARHFTNFTAVSSEISKVTNKNVAYWNDALTVLVWFDMFDLMRFGKRQQEA